MDSDHIARQQTSLLGANWFTLSSVTTTAVQLDAPPQPRRRWLSFRLSTLFLAMTAFAIYFGWPHINHEIQFWRLRRFVGQDLRKLPESEQQSFTTIVAKLIPRERENRHQLGGFGENWYLWRVPTDKGIRFVLFQGEPLWMIPGNSNAHVYLLNDSGRVVARSSFSTGYRITIEDAALVTHRLPEETLIEVHSAAEINGRNVVRQYYALRDDKLVLIRLEDSRGRLVPNSYGWQEHMIGPEPAIQTEAQWLSGLSDSRQVEVLQSLTWIGGSHRVFRYPGAEDLEQATLHQTVIANPDLSPQLQKLTTHPNPWIAEAAEQSLQVLVLLRPNSN